MVDDVSAHPEDKPKVLIVDDEEDIRSVLVTALEMKEDYEVCAAGSADEARKILSDQSIDVAVTDLIMPDEGGLELMRWAQENLPGTTWIILSGRGTFDDAVEAVHLGAYDFIVKPLPALDSFLVSIRNAMRQRQLEQERERLHVDIEERNVRLREQVAQLHDACRLLGEQAQIINDDLRRAELIQRALLPRTPPDTGHFSVNTLYRTSQNVGGDLYECLRLDYRYVLGYVADAAGHGVSAAMLAVLFKHRLHMVDESTGLPTPPGKVLNLVGRHLINECRAPGLFVTAAYFVLDLEQQTLTVASAGHPPIYLRRADGEIETVYHTGPALGITPEAVFAQKTLELRRDDLLLLCTDGLFEAAGEEGLLTHAELGRILSESTATGQDLLKQLCARLSPGDEEAKLSDDVTMMLLSLDDAPSRFDNGGFSEEKAQQEPPLSPETDVLVGREDNTAFVSVQGRGTWTHSTAFHHRCVEALEAGERLVLDLSLCRYLDSTFLGTVQEVTDMAIRRGVKVRVQGVVEELAERFEELGMDKVRERITDEPLPLPGKMTPLSASMEMGCEAGRRMLRAHEALCNLNERNREEFLRLVEGLRKELSSVEE